jgi:Na+/H+ antiporter NhaD/arsenite permease-like protein
MILSAQFRLAGTYSYIVRRIGAVDLTPSRLLIVIVIVTGFLSALLINDIICLAMAPVVIEICSKRNLNPIPFLLGVACASNIGSALTLVGNPQNILVGQTLQLSFSHYLFNSFVPVLLSGVGLCFIISYQYKNKWSAQLPLSDTIVPVFSKRQTIKGVILAVILLVIFVSDIMPRDLAALGVAGFLLCSRSMRSREMLCIVDWQLLVLFISLFIVNFSLNESSVMQILQEFIARAGIDLLNPGSLFVTSAVLSNIVSNVPAVMFLLPLAKHPQAGPVLALSSTLAGNFIVVGSIANIIVIEQAFRQGIRISWRQHCRTGIPVTLLSLLIAGIWLWIL